MNRGGEVIGEDGGYNTHYDYKHCQYECHCVM